LIDWFLVFNATFSNISAISWWPVIYYYLTHKGCIFHGNLLQARHRNYRYNNNYISDCVIIYSLSTPDYGKTILQVCKHILYLKTSALKNNCLSSKNGEQKYTTLSEQFYGEQKYTTLSEQFYGEQKNIPHYLNSSMENHGILLLIYYYLTHKGCIFHGNLLQARHRNYRYNNSYISDCVIIYSLSTPDYGKTILQVCKHILYFHAFCPHLLLMLTCCCSGGVKAINGIDWLIDFWCLMPLSAIFQPYHGDQF
jgi:hypothetical protein